MRSRGRLLGLAAVLVLAALVLLTPTAEDPTSASAARRFLEAMGFDVVQGDDLPADGQTLVLLHDLRSEEEGERILAWAEGGGNLVVADPGSAVLGLLGVRTLGPIDFIGVLELPPACITPQVSGLDRIAVRAGDIALATDDDAFIACFPAGEGAVLLTRRYGAGTVTILGGASAISNELLTSADNAGLAVGLAGASQAITFGGPGSPQDGSTGGLWEQVPDRAQAAIMAMVGAAVAFAVVRGRRLGRPMLEEPIAPIPASELVRAAARMYRNARAAGYAGRLLRDGSATRLARQFRTPARGRELVDAVARGTGVPEAQVLETLDGPQPRTDDELISLGNALTELASRAEQRSR